MKISYVLDTLDKTLDNLGTINLMKEKSGTFQNNQRRNNQNQRNQQKINQSYNLLFKLREEIKNENIKKKR